MDAPDADILQQFRDGDRDVHREVARWARSAVRATYRHASREETEDIVQHTMLDVWRATSAVDFALTHGLRAFVRRVAAARALDALRRRRATAPLDDTLLDPRLDPLEAVILRDRAARVRWALTRLGAGCRDLLRRYYVDGESQADIARATGRAVGTVNARMYQCRQQVQALLERWARSSHM